MEDFLSDQEVSQKFKFQEIGSFFLGISRDGYAFSKVEFLFHSCKITQFLVRDSTSVHVTKYLLAWLFNPECNVHTVNTQEIFRESDTTYWRSTPDWSEMLKSSLACKEDVIYQPLGCKHFRSVKAINPIFFHKQGVQGELTPLGLLLTLTHHFGASPLGPTLFLQIPVWELQIKHTDFQDIPAGPEKQIIYSTTAILLPE